MPEQNTPTPIKYEDIRKGDRIRRTEAIEYTADGGSEANEQISKTYELIKRPVVLPIEPGFYQDADGDLWKFNGVLWKLLGSNSPALLGEHIAESALPFSRMRPEVEIAAEVFAAIRAVARGDGGYYDHQFTAKQLRAVGVPFGLPE